MSSWVSERGVASVSVSYGFIQTWTEFCLTCWQSSVFWCWRDGFCHALIWFCSFVNSATHLEVTKPRFIRPIWINNHVWGVRQAWDRCETGVRQVCVTEQQQHKQPFSRRKLQHYKPFLFVNSRVLIGCLCWSDCVFLHMQLRVCVCVCVCAHRVFIFVKSLSEHRGELTDILKSSTDIYIWYIFVYILSRCEPQEQSAAVRCVQVQLEIWRLEVLEVIYLCLWEQVHVVTWDVKSHVWSVITSTVFEMSLIICCIVCFCLFNVLRYFTRVKTMNTLQLQRIIVIIWVLFFSFTVVFNKYLML